MLSIFTVTLPFFALVLCGFGAARSSLLPEAAIAGLNAYVLFFALPALLLRFGETTPFAQLLDPTLFAVYAACAALMVGLTIGLTHRRHGRVDTAFGALVGAFPNTGFMGVPLVVALLGPDAGGPMIITILVDLIFTSTLCLAIAQSARTDPDAARAAWHASVLRSLRGAVTNPLPWSIAIGAALSAFGLRLPGPVDQVIRLFADSATPVALFTIGAVLWRAGRHAHTRTPLAGYLPIAGLKLFVHPLLVAVVGAALIGLGAPVPRFGLEVLVLAAALPSASNVSLLAERFGADNGRVARIIMASTAGAFVSFPLVAWSLRALAR